MTNHIKAIYCKSCGKKLEAYTEQRGYCRKCGNKRVKVLFVCPEYTPVWNWLFQHDYFSYVNYTNVFKNRILCSECDKEVLDRIIGEEERKSL